MMALLFRLSGGLCPRESITAKIVTTIKRLIVLTVHFIRHGESTSNAGLATIHPALTPLTERGHAQAALTARALDIVPDLVVVSPYIRTRQTAQPLLDRFPNTPLAEWPVQEFTFLAPHHWDGTTVVERRPAAHAYWERADPLSCDGEGAESFVDLMERVRQTRGLIGQQKEGTLVIFSHGEFIRAFWWRMLIAHYDSDADAMRRYRAFIHAFRFPNCAILTFHFDGEKTWNSPISIAHIPADLMVM